MGMQISPCHKKVSGCLHVSPHSVQPGSADAGNHKCLSVRRPSIFAPIRNVPSNTYHSNNFKVIGIKLHGNIWIMCVFFVKDKTEMEYPANFLAVSSIDTRD